MPKNVSSHSPLILRGLALLFWMGLIFSFSSIRGVATAYDPPFWYFLERKGAHVFEYAILTLLAVRFFLAAFPKEGFRRILFLSVIFATAYGISDELHQFFVPYRGAKMTDAMIDGIGAVLMAGFLWGAGVFEKRGKQ